MITSLQGTLASSAPFRAVIDLNGIGYELSVPLTTAERLPSPGGSIKLHTLVVYREDSQTLYGFSTPEERDFFRLLIENVTGVGPKMALSVMSRLSLPSLEGAIRAGDIGTLAKCPGIGKKTAERLIVELRGKLGGSVSPTAGDTNQGAAAPTAGPGSNHHRDAVAALVALGYKTADADEAIRNAALALGSTSTTESLVKKALSG